MFRSRIELGKYRDQQNKEAERDNAFREIEEYIFAAEFGSPRYLAFSDFASKAQIELTKQKLKGNRYMSLIDWGQLIAEETAVGETIRTRSDTILGYNREIEATGNLYRGAVASEYSVISSDVYSPESEKGFKAREEVISKMFKLRKDFLKWGLPRN